MEVLYIRERGYVHVHTRPSWAPPPPHNCKLQSTTCSPSATCQYCPSLCGVTYLVSYPPIQSPIVNWYLRTLAKPRASYVENYRATRMRELWEDSSAVSRWLSYVRAMLWVERSNLLSDGRRQLNKVHDHDQLFGQNWRIAYFVRIVHTEQPVTCQWRSLIGDLLFKSGPLLDSIGRSYWRKKENWPYSLPWIAAPHISESVYRLFE